MKKIISTFVCEYPKLINLCEMWSVPPLNGDLPLDNLCSKTIAKSNSGIVKNKKIGFNANEIIFNSDWFQIKKMLKKPKQKPMNKLPESPR